MSKKPEQNPVGVIIVQISTLNVGFLPNGNPNIAIFGLGNNSRVYNWSYDLGQWVRNWEQPAPIAQSKAENRKVRRAAKSGGE
jgi:hypothetical protein